MKGNAGKDKVPHIEGQMEAGGEVVVEGNRQPQGEAGQDGQTDTDSDTERWDGGKQANRGTSGETCHEAETNTKSVGYRECYRPGEGEAQR